MQLISSAHNLFKHTPHQQQHITLSVVIPIFNEQEVITQCHQRVCQVLEALDGIACEIIYINDGSSDDSWTLINQLNNQHINIERINLSRNFGKEAAMTAGLDVAKGQAAILLDADLQDPPELIPDMLEKWQQGNDVVNMKRKVRHGESKFKTFSAHLYYRLLSFLSDVPIENDVGDFRLLSRRVINHIKQLPERTRYMKGIMAWPGFKQSTIEFERPERAAGTTKWSFLQLIHLGLSGITSFSVKPLKLATWLGILISLGAFLYSAALLVETLLFGNPVAGYPSMMLAQLWLGGVQLIAIGLLGEYIGRIYIESKARPVYIIMDSHSTKTTNQVERTGG